MGLEWWPVSLVRSAFLCGFPLKRSLQFGCVMRVVTIDGLSHTLDWGRLFAYSVWIVEHIH
jgi:hypothetical protein